MCIEDPKPQPVLPVSLNSYPRFTCISSSSSSDNLVLSDILVHCRETDQKVVHEQSNNAAQHGHTCKQANVCVNTVLKKNHRSTDTSDCRQLLYHVVLKQHHPQTGQQMSIFQHRNVAVIYFWLHLYFHTQGLRVTELLFRGFLAKWLLC